MINIPVAREPNTIVAILCALVFIVSSSGGFFSIPMTRLFEDRFCREYYGSVHSDNEPIDEDMCKVDVIQSRLAYMFAVDASIEAVMGCLVAMPWGLVADRSVFHSMFLAFVAASGTMLKPLV